MKKYKRLWRKLLEFGEIDLYIHILGATIMFIFYSKASEINGLKVITLKIQWMVTLLLDIYKSKHGRTKYEAKLNIPRVLIINLNNSAIKAVETEGMSVVGKSLHSLYIKIFGFKKSIKIN